VLLIEKKEREREWNARTTYREAIEWGWREVEMRGGWANDSVRMFSSSAIARVLNKRNCPQKLNYCPEIQMNADDTKWERPMTYQMVSMHRRASKDGRACQER
jgi:hypothetical protein